jgi:hypothetical protein
VNWATLAPLAQTAGSERIFGSLFGLFLIVGGVYTIVKPGRTADGIAANMRFWTRQKTATRDDYLGFARAVGLFGIVLGVTTVAAVLLRPP